MLGLCWPMLGLCWPMLSHLGSYVGAMFGSSMLKRSEDANFSAPGPAQNHVKTEVLWHHPDEIPCRRRARNTVKKMSFNTASKNIVNYMSFSRGGVDTGWVGGRGRSAYNLRLPPKASGKDGLRGRCPDLKAYAWQPGAGEATTFGLWCGKIGPRFSAQTQGGLCWTEAGIMPSACLYGRLWKQSGPMLSAGCAHVGPSRAHVEPSWAHLGLMLGQVGPMLSHRAHLGTILAQVGPISSQYCLMLLSEPTRN